MTQALTVEEADRFMRQFKILIAGTMSLVILPILGYAFYLHWRIQSVENPLRYRPPESVSESNPAESEVLVIHPVQGQIVYVPAYSHIYHGDGEPYLLTITLSVRNTSLDKEIILRSVRYFDTKGKEVKSYLAKPLRVSPLATIEFLVERNDETGGSGANFLVDWIAEQQVSEPIIEAVMIDTKGQQGISFARQGTAIRQFVPEESSSELQQSVSTATN